MLNIKRLRPLRSGILFLISAIVITSVIVSYTSTATPINANEWITSDDFTVTLHDNQNYDEFHKPNCAYEDVQLHPKQFMWAFEGDLSTECVYNMGDWKYALSSRRYVGWFNYQYDATSFIFNTDNSHRMYKVMNLTDHVQPIFIPHSKSIAKPILSSTPGADGIKIYKNILDRITPNGDDSFTADIAEPDFVFKRPDGLVQPIGRLAVSPNGKWMVFDANNIGLVRLNLDTYEMKRLAGASSIRTIGYDYSIQLDISDDGSMVSVAGYRQDLNLYVIDDSCGDQNLSFYSNKLTALATPCPIRNLSQQMRKLNPSFGYVSEVKFQKGAAEIHMWVSGEGYYSSFQSGRYVLRINDNLPQFRLDYLALGDSFSSGEGDTQVHQGDKYYLDGTDVDGDKQTPEEKCHISSRSYPFLLKDAMGLVDYSMQSLACSGAELRNDYIPDNNQDDYKGQGDRLSAYESDIVRLKAEALSGNIPGRIQQLEFIHKYRPRAITITGGGNDVGFGEVIRSCLMSNYYPCSYSSTESGKAAIGQGIARQYYKLNDLFTQIKKLSPDTKVYVVGYPQFVDDKSFFCAPNVPISQNERKMINEAVTYLNQVIEAAAVHSDVKYIDIENSLDGHKLCEKGTSYVTGLALARTIGFGTTLINHSELQESFHPNKNDHALMANAIRNQLDSQSLLYYDGYPAKTDASGPLKLVAPPAYFANSMANATVSYKKDTIITKKYVQKSSPTEVFDVRFGGFAPNSKVTVEVHSNPVVLGEHIADADGFLSVDIAIPTNIPAGFHTLHLIGQSDVGEAVDIWQGVEVRGITGDIDEDGIVDEVDRCIYVTESGFDADSDGIDDACDSSIDSVGQEKVDYPNLVAIQVKHSDSEVNSSDDSSAVILPESNDTQSDIEKLFYTPRLSSPAYGTSDIPDVRVSRFLISGITMFVLISIWMIKRYSGPNRK